MSVQELNSTDFEAALAATDKLIVVDLWAPWCGPCRAIGPIVAELAELYAGRAVVAKVNVDDSGDIAQKYGVMTIPTLLFIRNGTVLDKSIGTRSKQQLIELFEKNI